VRRLEKERKAIAEMAATKVRDAYEELQQLRDQLADQDSSRSEVEILRHQLVELESVRATYEADADTALEHWLLAERALATEAEEYGQALLRLSEGQATQEAAWQARELDLFRRIDHLRGMHEEILTAYERCRSGAPSPSLTDLSEWLHELPALVDAAAHDSAVVKQAQESVLVAIREVDRLRGLAETMQSAWLELNPESAPLAPEGLADWMLTLAGAHTMPLEAADLAHAQRRLESAEGELEQLRAHRDEVLADHLAVMSSESWRLGYALTWPLRVLRRNPAKGTLDPDLDDYA
jgi:hypothetical protein